MLRLADVHRERNASIPVWPVQHFVLYGNVLGQEVSAFADVLLFECVRHPCRQACVCACIESRQVTGQRKEVKEPMISKSAPPSKMKRRFKLCHCGIKCGGKRRVVSVLAVCAAAYAVKITVSHILL